MWGCGKKRLEKEAKRYPDLPPFDIKKNPLPTQVPFEFLFEVGKDDITCRVKTRMGGITMYRGATVGKGIFAGGVNLWKRRHQDISVQYDSDTDCHVIKGFYQEEKIYG